MPGFFVISYSVSLTWDFALPPTSAFLALLFLCSLLCPVHLELLQTSAQRPPISVTAPNSRTLLLLQNHRWKLLYQSLLQAALKTWRGRSHAEYEASRVSGWFVFLLHRWVSTSDDLSTSDFSCRPKDAFRAIKKRIVGNKNFHEVMLALTVSGHGSFSAL